MRNRIMTPEEARATAIYGNKPSGLSSRQSNGEFGNSNKKT